MVPNGLVIVFSHSIQMRAYVGLIETKLDKKFVADVYHNFQGTNNKWEWVAMAWV